MGETISLSKRLNQQKESKHHKVISLKSVAELNKEKSNGTNFSHEEQYATLQMKLENVKHQIASLEQQKEKMLNDLKEAIDSEKQEWMKQKEVEKKQAKEVGHKIGVDQGREEALTEYGELIEEANKIVDSATNDYYQTVEKHEQTIIKLAISMAEKIMEQKITEDHQQFTSIISKAIEELKDHSYVTIYVHPNKYRFVMKQKEELEQMVEDGDIISVYMDQELKPGDCMIKHPFGQIDIGIDSQLQQLKNALDEKLAEKHDGY